MEPVAIIGICAVVLIVGYLLGLTVGKSAATKQSDEVEQARAELKQYREQVSAHFGKTATHFQTLGQNYRELYEHMAAGADDLFEQGDSDKAVAFVPMEQLLAAKDTPVDVTPAADESDNDDASAAHDEQTADETVDQSLAAEAPVEDAQPPKDYAEDAEAPETETTLADTSDGGEPESQVSDAFAEETVEDIVAADDTSTEPEKSRA
jgi:uncharacterized membrane-anchored protein YhcB (DUF1043 family)